jgi:hypothetical protein
VFGSAASASISRTSVSRSPGRVKKFATSRRMNSVVRTGARFVCDRRTAVVCRESRGLRMAT